MPTKKRDYTYDLKYQSSPEQKKKRNMRNVARLRAIKKYGKSKLKGKDVDHIIPLKNGGTNKKSNLRIISSSKNRARKPK